MNAPEETLCFTCSQPLGDPPRLNHLPGGQVCPHCAERLLDTLPPLLPSRPLVNGEQHETEFEAEPEPQLAGRPHRLSPAEPELPPSA